MPPGEESAVADSAGGASVDDTILSYRLFEALRKGDIDKIQDLLTANPQLTRQDPPFQFPSHGTLLFVAASFAPKHVVQHLLSIGLDPNQANTADGQTALHAAAQHGRMDIITLFLSLKPTVDFSARDYQGNLPSDLAKTTEIASYLQSHRDEFAQIKIMEMHALANDPNSSTRIKELFECPVVLHSVDINAPNPTTGMSVLHELARCGNIDMLKWCLENLKADPLQRDRRGKYFYEVTKDDRMKMLFKRALQVAPIMTTAKGQTPSLAGLLEKWTNYASGYKSRWFVLEEGRLSYYKTQSDVPHSCRGSISLSGARIVIDTSDRHRFDIYGKGALKYHLRAEHVTEAQRWIFAINQSKHFGAEDDHKKESDKDAQSESGVSGVSAAVTGHRRKSNAPSENDGRRLGPKDAEMPKPPAIDPHGRSRKNSPAASPKPSGSPKPGSSQNPQDGADHESSYETDEEGDESRESLVQANVEQDYITTLDGVRLQISLLRQVMSSTRTKISEVSSSADLNALMIALDEGITSLADYVENATTLGDTRARFWKQRYESEKDRKMFWEDNMKSLAEEHDKLLHKASEDQEKMKTLRKLYKKKEEELKSSMRVYTGDEEQKEEAEGISTGGTPEPITKRPSLARAMTEDIDEFFDAEDDVLWLETPEVNEPESGKKDEAESKEQTKRNVKDLITTKSIETAMWGYETDNFSFSQNLRDRLPVDHSKIRDDVSIWGVLKKAIGKDLSKITLPASWNEPISFLQRMSEDLEYSSLMDVAWKASRSTDRLLFVSAFAMSNLASTIGRTGKPFNPLLGETFELVRKDRGFRLMCEQVSHHPPISACHGESDHWIFLCEWSVKMQFWGKYVVVNPLGTNHVYLKNPGGTSTTEHYSWKKVTTAVHNIIVGKPYVDHYGDMAIVNHDTGDKCVLTFKPASWRSSTTCEVEGKLSDKKGTVMYDVVGRWDDKLVARPTSKNPALARMLSNSSSSVKTNTSMGSGMEDELVNEDGEIELRKGDIVLWRRTKPESPDEDEAKRIRDANYNLTPWAVTLNQKPKELEEWLPPTDCRLRPDQQLMEKGEYGAAAEEKHRLEEKQRAARRARESSGSKYKPFWFTKEKEPHTKEDVWRFSDDYWKRRERKDWNGVPDLF